MLAIEMSSLTKADWSLLIILSGGAAFDDIEDDGATGAFGLCLTVVMRKDTVISTSHIQ